MTFLSKISQYDLQETRESIYAKTSDDVRNALCRKGKKTLEDFKAMISPAASGFVEEMAVLSHHLTQKRFGKTLQLYIPLYLSNECQNICTYCGFSMENKIKRLTLSEEQLFQEVQVIKASRFEHVLLVTGESGRTVGVDYIEKAIKLIRPFFSSVSVEIQPLDKDEYIRLKEAGLHAVFIYQETYNKEGYREYHLKGKKSNFTYRLETPDRLGESGIHKIGLGCLLGLEDWRTDSFFTALHLDYMEKQYWRTKYSVSFPRLRPAAGFASPKVIMKDRELLQLICAYRIFNEEVELSISTRETPRFRDNIIKLGITSMSAGSKTNPGGYASGSNSLEQFEIADERTADEIASVIRNMEYEPMWKDWDNFLE